MARRAEEIRDPYFSGDEVNIRISRRVRSEYGRLLSRFNERTRRWKENTHEKFRRDVNALFRCLRFHERLEVYRCRRHWRFIIAIAVERDEEEAETSSDSDGGLSEDEAYGVFRGMGKAHRSRKSRKAKVNDGGSKSMEHGSKHAATSAELRNTPEDVDGFAILEKLNTFRGELINLESRKENMEKGLGNGEPAGQVK